MFRDTPEQLLKSIVDGINSGDLDGLLSLYEPDAAFASQPGILAHGTTGVRDSLAAFIAMKGTLDIKLTRVLEAGGLAFVAGVSVVHRHGAGRHGCHPDGPQRRCTAAPGGRHLALRDRQPVGHGLIVGLGLLAL